MGKARRNTPTMGRGGTTSAAPGAVLAFVLGLFTKEMVVTLPLLMLAYDWYRHFPTNLARIDLAFFRTMVTTLGSVMRTYARLYGPIFVIAALFLIEKLFIHNPVKKAERNGQRYPYDAGRPNPDRTCAREVDAARFSRTFSPGGRGY